MVNSENFTLTSKVLYSYEESHNRPRTSDSPGNGPQGLLTLPINYNVNDLIGNPQMPGTVPEGVTTPDGKAPGEEYQISPNLWNVKPMVRCLSV